ncbi:hypothetical protein [Bdellovibrio reynosensis]|uniref:Uncharacterized protein n=1 Tax=Bdellovibrio reynosensis TaxID=2835041 RepID=A0ABY4CA92_9BACT|nr:hypothetical protein [Bdellovibrio reynosensis]UOF01773.1 hypothetical protein MNR06_02245 [Bdellovibrio reynosensis]
MSKIIAVQDLISAGSSLNDESGGYLLWFMESIEIENKILAQARLSHGNTAANLANVANAIALARIAVDRGECSVAQYEASLSPMLKSIEALLVDT